MIKSKLLLLFLVGVTCLNKICTCKLFLSKEILRKIQWKKSIESFFRIIHDAVYNECNLS